MMRGETPNPYRAPQVRVEEPRQISRPELPKPREVRAGLTLLWIGFALECLLATQSMPEILREEGAMDVVAVWVTIAAVVVIFTCVAVLIVMIGKCRNWARVVYLILSLLGVLSYLVFPEELLDESVFVVATTIASNVIQLVALVLLFLPVSNAWFRSRGSLT